MQFKKSLLLWCVRFRSFECHGLSDLQTAVAVASAAAAAVVVAVAAVVDAVVVWPTVSASPEFAASSTARHFLACRRTRQRRLRSKCLAMAQLCRGRLELNVKFKMLFFTKNGHSRPLFRLVSVFSNINTIFTQQINVKNDLRGCGIRTQDLLNMSLLP